MNSTNDPKSIQSSKVKITIIICGTVMVVLGILFYWYEYRPSEIRKECNEIAIANAMGLFKEKSALQPYVYSPQKAAKGMYLTDDYETYYRKCLRDHGVDATKNQR